MCRAGRWLLSRSSRGNRVGNKSCWASCKPLIRGGESRGVCAHSLDASLSGDVASDGISVGSKYCGRKEETSRSFSSLSGSSLRLLQEEQCKEEKTLGPGVVGADPRQRLVQRGPTT